MNEQPSEPPWDPMTVEEFAQAKAMDTRLHDPPILDQEMTPELHRVLVSLFVHGRCGECGAGTDNWTQRGRCVYCGGCGKRLYQGRIP